MNKKVIESTLCSFFIHELLLFSNEFIYPSGNLDEKTNQKNQVCAYKSVNNGYSLNALEHSHMKCEQ